MGVYLNNTVGCMMYSEVVNSPYFVDKTTILDEIISRIGTTEKYICITRPRRFGKSVMANMIAAFFSKKCDTNWLFRGLDIAQSDNYSKHINSQNVVYISMNEMPKHCKDYLSYIDRVETKLIKDLVNEFPDIDIDENDAVWDILSSINGACDNVQFLFVLDEWDFIFHQDFVTVSDKKQYIQFLSNLLKGKPYVSLVYMTGILPIAKYSSGSELNMFLEYTMASEKLFSNYFGFTESEVDTLFARFLKNERHPEMTREELCIWYDGYNTLSGENVYNPRSVVASLTNNNLANYWTSAGPYDEIFYYIEHNVDAVRDDIALMVSGISVPCKVREYAATSMKLSTRDEIFSAMVVYGFLSYDNGCVRIPNKELMDKFMDMLRKEQSLGYVFNLARESERLLKATLSCDEGEVCRILEYTHNTEIPLLSYNQESDLTAVIMLAYLSARDKYIVRREDKAGTGYVDFSFTPENTKDDCMILELKVNHTAEEAIRQIKERKYELLFRGKIGEKQKYTGRILAVGIAYDKREKIHTCKIEVLREALPDCL